MSCSYLHIWIWKQFYWRNYSDLVYVYCIVNKHKGHTYLWGYKNTLFMNKWINLIEFNLSTALSSGSIEVCIIILGSLRQFTNFAFPSMHACAILAKEIVITCQGQHVWCYLVCSYSNVAIMYLRCDTWKCIPYSIEAVNVHCVLRRFSRCMFC